MDIRTVHRVYAVVSVDGHEGLDYISGIDEDDVTMICERNNLSLLEWCGTEEACKRSISARLSYTKEYK